MADALDLGAIGEVFETVLDCGLFHVFDDDDRARLVASLHAVVVPGGRYHMLCFSDRQPGDLLWYSDGGSTTATKYHVTIYIGNNQMIEAPYPGVNVRVAALRYGDLVPFAGRPTG